MKTKIIIYIVLLVIGGGPIGIELGQAFNRLGSNVSVIQRGPCFLPKEDKEITDVLLKKLKKEGMKFYFNSTPKKFVSYNKVIIGNKTKINFDSVLISVGRELNIENLDLGKAGIKLDESGKKIIVNSCLQTTNKNVFLCGDIAGSYQFTHAAELHAKIILNNFFSLFKKKLNYDDFSWVTYTTPEIATFGLNEGEIKKRNIRYKKLILNLSYDDRAIVEDYREGKIILYISSGKLLGGSLVSSNAGELFQELVLAKTSNLEIKHIFNKIYPYPTASRINKRIISNYIGNKLTLSIKKIMRFLY
ncbi:hypothetical protein CMI39_00215 [Candidatus Pacearchaeota archaeon]|jgi:pyruvate/2-oxoglutarate dehydrogenase complex dihydrolipoamide dehydrogenase (E3) component|nr:hypothetical protein [Candidatus Pacearchaeota archaeon]|tara:strand:+ start:3252 stop:4163 length:912 start_codon:yes stop_codon:yes gene_type:complete